MKGYSLGYADEINVIAERGVNLKMLIDGMKENESWGFYWMEIMVRPYEIPAT